MIKIKCEEKEDYKVIKRALDKNHIPYYMKKKKEKDKDHEEETSQQEADAPEEKIVKRSLIVEDEGYFKPVDRILAQLKKKDKFSGEVKCSKKGSRMYLIEAEIPAELIPPEEEENTEKPEIDFDFDE